MSDENVEFVRRRFASALEDDWETALDMLHPDVEIHDFDMPDAGGIYRGHEGYRAWVLQWLESWETTRVEDAEFRAAGAEGVLVLFRLVAKGAHSGLELERDDAVLYRFRRGRIARIDYYNDQVLAIQAAGELG
jgi:ketosteroid isomerase-like protein